MGLKPCCLLLLFLSASTFGSVAVDDLIELAAVELESLGKDFELFGRVYDTHHPDVLDGIPAFQIRRAELWGKILRTNVLARSGEPRDLFSDFEKFHARLQESSTFMGFSYNKQEDIVIGILALGHPKYDIKGLRFTILDSGERASLVLGERAHLLGPSKSLEIVSGSRVTKNPVFHFTERGKLKSKLLAVMAPILYQFGCMVQKLQKPKLGGILK